MVSVSSVPSYVISITVAFLLLGLVFPIGFNAWSDFLPNLTGDNSTIAGLIALFVFLGLAFIYLAPAIKSVQGVTGKGR